jgi:hypothetical protein
LSGFIFFYFFALRFYLTRIAEVFKFRKKLSDTFGSKNTTEVKAGTYDAILLTQIAK